MSAHSRQILNDLQVKIIAPFLSTRSNIRIEWQAKNVPAPCLIVFFQEFSNDILQVSYTYLLLMIVVAESLLELPQLNRIDALDRYFKQKECNQPSL